MEANEAYFETVWRGLGPDTQWALRLFLACTRFYEVGPPRPSKDGTGRKGYRSPGIYEVCSTDLEYACEKITRLPV